MYSIRKQLSKVYVLLVWSEELLKITEVISSLFIDCYFVKRNSRNNRHLSSSIKYRLKVFCHLFQKLKI